MLIEKGRLSTSVLLSQKSKMGRFARKNIKLKTLTVFEKYSLLDIGQGSEYPSAKCWIGWR